MTIEQTDGGFQWTEEDDKRATDAAVKVEAITARLKKFIEDIDVQMLEWVELNDPNEHDMYVVVSRPQGGGHYGSAIEELYNFTDVEMESYCAGIISQNIIGKA